jgi:hypothetical protein
LQGFDVGIDLGHSLLLLISSSRGNVFADDERDRQSIGKMDHHLWFLGFEKAALSTIVLSSDFGLYPEALTCAIRSRADRRRVERAPRDRAQHRLS